MTTPTNPPNDPTRPDPRPDATRNGPLRPDPAGVNFGKGAAGRSTANATSLSDVAVLLNDKLERMINESVNLRTDVTADQAQRVREMARRRQENLVMLGFLAVLSILMIGILGVAWQNNMLSREVRHNAEIIEDCITPTGECYRRGQARTGGAVLNIQRIQLYIVECSRQFPTAEYPPGPEFDRLFEKCVADRLAKANAAGGVDPQVPRNRPTPSPGPGR